MRTPFLPKDEAEEVAKTCTEDYRVFGKQGVTICLLTMPGGFHVTGESSCPANRKFDPERGKLNARARAVERLWNYERYRRSFTNGEDHG